MAIKRHKNINNIVSVSLIISLMAPSVVMATGQTVNLQKGYNIEVETDNAGIVTKSKVTVRGLDSNKNIKLGTLKKGQLIKIVNTTQDTFEIDYNGEIGSINKDAAEKLNIPEGTVIDDINKMAIVSENFKVIKSKTEIRNGVSPRSKVLDTLKKDEVVIVLKENKGFGQVDYNGKIGYIDLKDLEYVSSNVQSNYGDIAVKYVDSSTNLEISEQEIYSDLKLNKKYTYNAKEIEGYEIKGNPTQTVKLTPENDSCAVVFEYEKVNREEDTSEYPGSVTINYIEKGTENKISESLFYTDLELQEYNYLPKDIEGYKSIGIESAKVILTKENPSQVINFEYEKDSEIEDTEQPQLYTMVRGAMVEVKDATWLRSTASWSADKIVILQKGDKAEVISKTDSWVKVKYNDKVGYLTADYVIGVPEEDESTPVLKKYKVTTSSSALTVRSGAGSTYEKIGSVEKGSIIEVFSITNGWAKIKFGETVGYVSADYITEYNESTPVLKKYKVTTSSSALTVRSGAGSTYEKIGSVEKGSIIEVYSITNGWAKIKFGETVGYVSASYITEYTESTPVLKKYKVTTSSSALTVRSGAGSTYSKIGSLEKGTIIEVYSITNGWAKIKFGETIGYVSADYITEYNESQSSNSGAGKTVYLDAGHGGTDPGAIGKTYSTKEKDMVLDVTTIVANKLRDKGYVVLESRTTDVYKTLGYRSTDANSKDSDIFVSMHFNSATNTSAQGLETLYKVDGRTSNILADKVQKELISATGLKNRGLKQRSDLSVLNKTTMPAILVEGGFLSNSKEENLIKSSSFRESLANAIVSGIEAYFKAI